jgi:hypothetical protein
MKKILIISAAILALVGCAKESAQIDTRIIDGKEYMVFKVVANDDVYSSDTKATLGRDGVFGWENNDPIYFVAADDSQAQGVYSKSEGTITVESGVWVAASTAPFDSHTKIKDFGQAKGPVVVAKVEGSTLNFHHVGSIINLKFADIPIDGDLEFWPNGGEKWAGGSFSFPGGFGYAELDGGGSDDIYIKRHITTADAGKDISLSVPNINYTGGFTVALSGTSARYFIKSTENAFDLYTNYPVLLNMKELSLPTYTIAGEQTAFFGSNWDVSDTNNDMVLDTDGLYKKAYRNTPASLEFKIVENHAWGTEWPYGSNKTHTVSNPSGGATITFNRGANEITVKDYNIYTVVGVTGLCGTFWGDDWEATYVNDMTEVSPGVYYKKFSSVPTSVGETDDIYQLKVVKNYSWAENWGGEYGGNFMFETAGSDVEVYFYLSVPSIKVVCDYTPKYRIAGNSSVLFGTTWDTGNDANLMTDLGNGTYQISYVCPADENGVGFKVTKDNTWSYAWPSSDNYYVDVKAGQTLTIFYNPTTCTGNVTVE